MTRTRGWRLRAACAALTPTLLLAPCANAQSPDPAKLDALLTQLKGADGATWKARAAAMDAAGKAAAARGGKLRAQAAARDKAAAAEDAASKALADELTRLEQLRGLIAALRFVDPAGGKDAKASD